MITVDRRFKFQKLLKLSVISLRRVVAKLREIREAGRKVRCVARAGLNIGAGHPALSDIPLLCAALLRLLRGESQLRRRRRQAAVREAGRVALAEVALRALFREVSRHERHVQVVGAEARLTQPDRCRQLRRLQGMCVLDGLPLPPVASVSNERAGKRVVWQRFGGRRQE